MCVATQFARRVRLREKTESDDGYVGFGLSCCASLPAGFAEGCGVGGDVEDVVHHLDVQGRPRPSNRRAPSVPMRSGVAPSQRAHAHRRAQQCARFSSGASFPARLPRQLAPDAFQVDRLPAGHADRAARERQFHARARPAAHRSDHCRPRSARRTPATATHRRREVPSLRHIARVRWAFRDATRRCPLRACRHVLSECTWIISSAALAVSADPSLLAPVSSPAAWHRSGRTRLPPPSTA